MGYFIIGLMLIVVALIIYRLVTFTNKPTTEKNLRSIEVDGMKVAEKLSAAIQIPTVSFMNRNEIDTSKFTDYHEMLKDKFPLIHERLERKVINQYSLLYKWHGTANKKEPILFMAHIDVVPIAEGTEGDWQQPPFSGKIEDGIVWGRGALDTKVTMITSLEAVELLLKQNHQPPNDIYLAFGHDEEIQGAQGATKVAEYLKAEGIHLRYILDEGGVVNIGSIPGVDSPVAVVGICEKGYADIKVSLKGEGGHASMPPKSTALGQMSQVVNHLEKHQMPMVMTDAVQNFMLTIGPSMGFANRMILSNLWLFKPLFMKVFSNAPTGNAMLRTTTAATMSKASNASNVLPQSASVTFNFRINPADSVEKVVAHIKSVSSNQPIEIEVLQATEPSKVSSITSDAYKSMEGVINHVFNGVLVAPYVMMAATDSVKYQEVCEDIYRFAPYVATKEALDTIHNTNEKISIENLEKCVEFYTLMILEG